MIFSPSRSPLAKSQDAINFYANALEKGLGNRSRVLGIVEFGSYAKDEAIPFSDVDTRVYVANPDYYIWQPVIGRFSRSQKDASEQRFSAFKKESGALFKKEYDWWKFNNPLAEKISSALGISVEFGFVDYRYAAFELQHLDSFPTAEHAILLQSNILYDPQELVVRMQEDIRGIKWYPMSRHIFPN